MEASTSSTTQEVMLYPAYIDAAKTCKGGRRVPKRAAVERPHVVEMYDSITKGLCLQAQLELDKKYSRDWLNPGRVRVSLKRADGAPCNADIPTKSALLLKCSDLCKRHQDRPRRLEETKKMEAQLFAGGAAPPKESTKGGDKGGPEKSGKVGKGKKGKKK